MKEAFREEAIGALCSGGAHPEDESPDRGVGEIEFRPVRTEGFMDVCRLRRLEELANDLRQGPNAGVEIASVQCSRAQTRDQAVLAR